ncbi:MAG: DedA family protein, partial [Burkholderiales bacterium]|nr:DedA family protein [Burkholderiales bacterium]
MSLEELISTYGYIAITIGVFLEGETFLILGGFAAHRGYLELIWVIACAFLATFLNGQLLYFLGNIKGERFLEKRPSLKHKSLKVLELLRN